MKSSALRAADATIDALLCRVPHVKVNTKSCEYNIVPFLGVAQQDT